MLDMLEKLINEHGSSAILRERLELFSDKYSMLEEKNSHLQERNKELEAQLQKANEEIGQLQSIVQANSKDKGTDVLANATQNVLKYFFDTAVDFTAERVCQQFSLEPGIAQYHIDNLMEKELLTHGALYVNQPMRYCISKRGRAYIIEQTTTE